MLASSAKTAMQSHNIYNPVTSSTAEMNQDILEFRNKRIHVVLVIMKDLGRSQAKRQRMEVLETNF